MTRLPSAHSCSRLQSLQLPMVQTVIHLAEVLHDGRPPANESDRHTRQKALCRYLGRLGTKSLAELIALMWLGRCPEGQLEAFASLVAEAAGTLESGPAYLAGKVPLAHYLRRGLQRLHEPVRVAPKPHPALAGHG